jgi:hypothetical protein
MGQPVVSFVTSGEADAKKDRSMTQTDLETWSWKPLEVGRFQWESNGNLGIWLVLWKMYFPKHLILETSIYHHIIHDFPIVFIWLVVWNISFFHISG